ncbi:MAG: class A beta-lactamase, partial [Verrucomicrobia bacterium]
MVRSFLLLTFLAVSAASGENDAATRFAAIETRIGGRIGVVALDISNSKRIDYRAD